ncbi:MAG TPA: glycosyltransferase [Chitinophagaceae bacterium]|nr:glycosyltransferase [Chitinophagaceae bacterium]
MKYWLLTTEYPPLHGGGISTYCFFTAQMLAEAGHMVTVFTNDDSKPDFTISNDADTIRIIRFNSNRDGLQQSLGYTARLSYAFAGMVKKMIEAEGKPDFIESQDYLGIAYYITQFKHAGYAFLKNVPIVLTIHSPAFVYLLYNQVPVYRFPDFWTGEMEKQSIAAADALISPTDFMLQEIKKYVSIPGKQTMVIANPYRVEHLPNPSFIRNKIVYYGKLSAQKGSFELLAYFKELWDDGFPHPLHIIGGTDIVFYPEMKTMGQLVNKQYADYIEKGLLRLHGKIQPSQINDYLQDAHIIVVPSIVDNMPYVVMEAMSRGKIVLASIQGGQREMTEAGVSGFLFDHNEAGSFSSQLNKILSLPDEQVQRVGAHAYQRVVKYFNFETIWQQKKQFLDQVKPIPGNYFPFLYQEKIQPVAETVSLPGLLSVVIPFYNMGKYIEDCVSAVSRASYKNIELLLINDGSTAASSIAKLQQFASQKNITIINRPNQGLAATRNFGATIARGEFLAFLDADDTIAPGYYEKAIAALVKNDNVFFAGAWVQYFENSHLVWPAFTPQPPYALLHNPVNSSSLVYKRSAFLAGGLNDKKVNYGLEDYESVIHMLKKGFNGVVLPEVLFHYRVRTGSMFRNITREKLLFSNKYIAEKHQDFYSAYALPILHLLNANGPGYLYDNPTFEIQVSASTRHENVFWSGLKAIVRKNERLKRMALTLLKIRSKP